MDGYSPSAVGLLVDGYSPSAVGLLVDGYSPSAVGLLMDGYSPSAVGLLMDGYSPSAVGLLMDGYSPSAVDLLMDGYSASGRTGFPAIGCGQSKGQQSMGNKFGIDLGTANLYASLPGEGIVMREPSVIAINRKTGVVVGVGADAQARLDTPGMVLMRPFKNGLTANCDITFHVMSSCLKATFGRDAQGCSLLVNVPCDMTDIEEIALVELALRAGVKDCRLVYAPLAAMAGSYDAPCADCLLVDMGAAKTSLLLLFGGNILYTRAIDTAGERFDAAIVDYISRKFQLQISLRTAEQLKMEIGAVWNEGPERGKDVRGRDLQTGAPRSVRITSDDMFEALEEPMGAILEAICIAVSKIPLEYVAGVFENGILLCGGTAQLSGMEKMIEGISGVRTRCMNNPMESAAAGLANILRWLPEQLPTRLRNISKYYIENFT